MRSKSITSTTSSSKNNTISLKKEQIVHTTSYIGGDTIIVPVHCRLDYCNSSYFKKLPYQLLQKYNKKLYELIYFKELKYSTDIYLETTENAMKIFSAFSTQKNIKNKFNFMENL
jgi:hypothetical protein